MSQILRYSNRQFGSIGADAGHLETDDSPEFLLAVFKAWFLHLGIKPIQIAPVSPMEDG
jgi:hypothetical protein